MGTILSLVIFFVPSVSNEEILGITTDGQGHLIVRSHALQIQDQSGQYLTNIWTGNSTHDRLFTLPDKNGTIAMLSDVTGGIGLTSINGDVTLAQLINGVPGNTTVATSLGTTTINLSWNAITAGGSAQTITKSLTLNSLILGGNLDSAGFGFTISGHKGTLPANTGTFLYTNGSLASLTGNIASKTQIPTIDKSQVSSTGSWSNAEIAQLPALGTAPSPARQTNIVNSEVDSSAAIAWSKISKSSSVLNDIGSPTSAYSVGSQRITNVATPTSSTDAQNANHYGLLGSLVVGLCGDQNHIKYQTSNSTWLCDTAIYLTSALTSLNGNSAASQTIAVTSPITIAEAGATHTIACSTCAISGSALTETTEASQTPLAGATSTVPGISLRWYQFYPIPSTEKFYLITGIEWINKATVAGNVQCGVDRVNAIPPTLAPAELLAFSSQVAQAGVSAIQRNSQVVSHPIKAGTLVGAWCESDSSTATFGTTAVTSANNRKTITFTANPPNQDVTAWTANTVGFSVKIYYVGYK